MVLAAIALILVVGELIQWRQSESPPHAAVKDTKGFNGYVGPRDMQSAAPSRLETLATA